MTSSQIAAVGRIIRIVTRTPGPGDQARIAAATVPVTLRPSRSARSRNVPTTVGFGADARTSFQRRRCVTMSARRRLRVTQTRIGMPITSAYQRPGPCAAFATELETSAEAPSVRAASSGVSATASDASPRPPTDTSAAGRSQRKRR